MEGMTLANKYAAKMSFLDNVLSSSRDFAGLSVDPNDFAFFHEQRHAHFEAGLELRHFCCAACCGITAGAGLGGCNRQPDI